MKTSHSHISFFCTITTSQQILSKKQIHTKLTKVAKQLQSHCEKKELTYEKVQDITTRTVATEVSD